MRPVSCYPDLADSHDVANVSCGEVAKYLHVDLIGHHLLKQLVGVHTDGRLSLPLQLYSF